MNDKALQIGDALPAFENLRGIDGKRYSSNDFNSDIIIIVFSCNHCPYVKHVNSGLVALANEYIAKGVSFIGINSNDRH